MLFMLNNFYYLVWSNNFGSIANNSIDKRPNEINKDIYNEYSNSHIRYN